MSILASFYLWPKDKFAEYCKMAHLVPSDQRQSRPQKGTVYISPPLRPDYKEQCEHYDRLDEFVKKNAREPFEFNWNGEVMVDLISYLKEEKKIVSQGAVYRVQFSEEFARYSQREAKVLCIECNFRKNQRLPLKPKIISSTSIVFFIVSGRTRPLRSISRSMPLRVLI